MNADEEILKELRIIRSLLVSRALRDLNQKESIAVLSRAGLAPMEIADTLGTTSNTVRVALSALRKEGSLPRAERRSRGRSNS